MGFKLNSEEVLSIFAASAIFILFKLYAHYKLSYWRRRGVEQLSTSDSIFGDIKDAFLFRTSPGLHLGMLHKAAKTDTGYFGFYIFHKPCLLLRDPQIIKQIMIQDFENFSDRHFGGSVQKDSAGMKNLFGLKNPAWKYLRSKISPTLTLCRLRKMFPLMIETSEPMMQFLRSCVANKKSQNLDVQELSYKYAIDLIANVALGTQMDSFNYPNGKFTKSVMNFFHGAKRMIALVAVFFTPELVEMIGSPLLFDTRFMAEFFWKALVHREHSGRKRGDFIDSVLQLKNGQQNDLYKLEGENLLFQSGAFLSGFESSATVISFTLMEMANYPVYQTRVRQDIEKSIEKYGWTYEAINDMKYLDNAIAESIRLHPPVSTIDRYTRQDYTIPGTNIVVERGTPIYVALYGLHQDARFFDKPEVFNPERCSDGLDKNEAYMPFGIGPRMCVAVKLGLLHAKIVIAMILREFEISARTKNAGVLDPRSTLTSAAKGILLNFKRFVDAKTNESSSSTSLHLIAQSES